MSIEDRMQFTGAAKRGDGSATSDGAGGFTQAASSVGAVKYARWVPGAYTRTTIRAEMGLIPNAAIFNASIAYNSAVQLRDEDWIVEDTTGYIFRIVNAQQRRGMSDVSHWSATFVKLEVEPTER